MDIMTPTFLELMGLKDHFYEIVQDLDHSSESFIEKYKKLDSVTYEFKFKFKRFVEALQNIFIKPLDQFKDLTEFQNLFDMKMLDDQKKEKIGELKRLLSDKVLFFHNQIKIVHALT